jgi:hypothetical protein
VNNEAEDASALYNKIDELEYKLQVQDANIKNTTEENQALNSQNKGLRLVKNATCIYTTDVEETNL